MTKPPVRFEWRINLTHVFSIVACVSTIAVGYFDLKSDVRNNQTKADAKFKEYDDRWAAQSKVDDEQNQRIVRAFNVVTDLIREVKTDLRLDIRDLRSDLARTGRVSPAATVVEAPMSPERNLRNSIARERERGG